MLLSQIIEGLNPVLVKGSTSAEVTGICHDSRHFQAGNLFVAIKGLQFDGHLFVDEACKRGASAVVVEDDRVVSVRFSIPVIKVKNSRLALALLSHNFYEHPSEKMTMVGVTGTNGKSTTARMVETILSTKVPAGIIGTIENRFGRIKFSGERTTPDALELQALLAAWRTAGAQAVSMEVSSHAIELARVENIAFDVCVFTNLTRDHLDFHKTMDAYIKAKARLFRELLKKSPKKNKRAIINIDDSHYSSMVVQGLPTWTYGFSKGDIRATHLELSLDGTTFEALTPAGVIKMRMKMIGKHNVSNSLAAIGVGLHCGISPQEISRSLETLEGVRGRLERVPSKSPIRVFVDYAHSDDALKNVLGFLKTLRDEREPDASITTVFGCGGDRDRGKRPLMLKAAETFSDKVILTSDNPRTEDPMQIINDALKGSAHPDAVVVEPDRRRAIEIALKKSKPGDVVLIAGKGHEDYQIVGIKKNPFDDVKVAKEFLDK